MADALNDARKLIEGRLQEVREELAHLERVLRDLGGHAPRRRGRKARRTPTSRRRGTATREERMKSLIAQARKAPGSSNAELAKALGVTPSYVSQLLAEGRKTGRVQRRNGKLVIASAGGRSGGANRRKPTSRRPARASAQRGRAPRRRKQGSGRGASRP